MSYKILKMKENLEWEEIEIKDRIVSYEELRNAVGNIIEHVTFNLPFDRAHVDVWIDEEGKLRDLEPTVAVVHRESKEIVEVLNGVLVFTGSNDRGDSVALTQGQMDIIKKEMKEIVQLISRNPFTDSFSKRDVRVLPYR